ncbi:(3R)-3-hydroxyacyl-CoA dehydrogenase-like [Amblyomma americanum]
MSLHGQLALVTGGASGIGEAVCRTLAAEGVTVVVADKHVEAAQKVAVSLGGEAKHCAMHVDVGDSSSVEKLFHDINAVFSQPLSIVVNCAGILRRAPLVECTEELFDDVIRVNLKGTFAVTRAASREMLRSGKKLPEGGAAIVNVASIAARRCTRASAAYAASKAGVVALTKSAAQELAAHGIRCNTVLPGWADTAMTAAIPSEIRAMAISETPLKRTAKPQVCSPTASSYITGAALEVTGGVYM